MHPTTKILRLANHTVLFTFAHMLDNYAMTRTISGKGHYVMRHFGIVRGVLIVVVSSVFLAPFFAADCVKDT